MVLRHLATNSIYMQKSGQVKSTLSNEQLKLDKFANLIGYKSRTYAHWERGSLVLTRCQLILIV